MGLFLLWVVNCNGLKTGDEIKWWMVPIIREVNASYTRKKGKRRVKCIGMGLKLAGTQESCLFSEVESCDPIKAFLRPIQSRRTSGSGVVSCHGKQKFPAEKLPLSAHRECQVGRCFSNSTVLPSHLGILWNYTF